jgi:hypothetical protein
MSRREAAHRENEIESGGSVWHVLRCQIFMNDTPPTTCRHQNLFAWHFDFSAT